VAPDRRAGERAHHAVRLVRQLVADAGQLGITLPELRAAVARELSEVTA
jgi:hypothetical protein